jgi:peptidoglycan/LPS O-acetylase OafA/YrhL
MPELPSYNTHRLHYLDALRGIASLMVVVYHFIGWRWENNPEFHWGAMLFNGSDAVSFFFVLSGLGLAFPYFQ